ncbi:MAG: hypothetical protein AAF826_08595 [Pseudomonadota bacterium]
MANATDVLHRVSRDIPTIHAAHWLIRLPLAAIIINQAVMKFPLTAADADSWGLPFWMWALSAFAELGAGIALIAGGLRRNAVGDVLTRLAGLAIAGVVIGVLYVVYWAPLLDLWLANQFHILLLVGGLYFALRGNHA